MSNEIALRDADRYMPKTLDEIVRIGKIFAESGLYPDSRDIAKACVKIIAGAELGIPPNAAMRDIYVMQGKTELSGAMQRAKVKMSGRYDYRIVEWTDERCVMEWFDGGESMGQSKFDIDDAKRAGLTNDNYKKHPRDMMLARATSKGVNAYCPDVLMGSVYSEGEIDQARVDVPDSSDAVEENAQLIAGEVITQFDAIEITEETSK